MEESKNKNTLAKGEQMEENLKNYFLGLGYYVVRGVRFQYQGIDITDIDLWLYSRSTLTRHRTNVDIKNKKTPQAIERIFWAKGVKETLGFDNCIVATTDKRELVKEFGLLHNVTVLDGNLLAQLKNNSQTKIRITEEEFLELLSQEKSKKFGSDWKNIYENAKSRLVNELDYSGCNATISDIKNFAENIILNSVKRETACRVFYVLISQYLIMLDYLSKDLNFLDQESLKSKLSDGLKFGNLGKIGLERTIDMAIRISGGSNSSISRVKSMFDDLKTDILTEFFAKQDNIKNLFKLGKEFEVLAFKTPFQYPNQCNNEIQTLISLLLDYSAVERKKFFSCFPKS